MPLFISYCKRHEFDLGFFKTFTFDVGMNLRHNPQPPPLFCPTVGPSMDQSKRNANVTSRPQFEIYVSNILEFRTEMRPSIITTYIFAGMAAATPRPIRPRDGPAGIQSVSPDTICSLYVKNGATWLSECKENSQCPGDKHDCVLCPGDGPKDQAPGFCN